MAVTDGWSSTTSTDVLDRWPGPGDPPLSDTQITTLIEDAEDIILGEFPDMPERLGASVPVRRVKRVISRMVIRLMRNPEGVRTVQHSTPGSFSESITRGGDHPGELYLTDDDRRDLATTGSGRRAFTIRPRLRGH